jgi:hypothetical protein
MEPAWAAEHLQVIRTLMERSALYRRALAPIMIYVGAVGLLAAGAGWFLRIQGTIAFVLYWYGVGVVALAGAFLMVRRQAWQQSEPFWSPPTRRIAQAMLPALTAGFVLGALMLLAEALPEPKLPSPPGGTAVLLVLLPLFWVVFYGCAVHAAGFFMARGIRLFGWGIIVLGCAAFFLTGAMEQPLLKHLVMGFFFGLLHLAYGTYLYFTEQRRNEM